MTQSDRKFLQPDSTPQIPANQASPNSKGRPSRWAYVLIIIGVLSLLELVGVESWGTPLVMIVIGVALLTRPHGWGLQLSLGLLVAGLLAAGIWIFNGQALPGRSTTETVSQQLTAARAEIQLGTTVGKLEIGANSSGKLIDGTLELNARDRLTREVSIRGEVQFVRLEAETRGVNISLPNFMNLRDTSWKLGLSPKVPLVLRIHTGVGSSRLDLTDLKVTEFRLESGVGQTTVFLPSSGLVNARIESGVGETTVILPRGVEARVRASSGIGQVRVLGDYSRDGDVYTSSGFESSSNRVELEVQGGVGQVTVEQSTR